MTRVIPLRGQRCRRRATRRPRPTRQRGSALVVMLLVVVVGVTYALLASLNQRTVENRDATRTRAALALARVALEGYAATYPDRYAGAQGPGRLPCPDTDGDGSPNPPCGAGSDSQPAIGLLPDEFLGLGPLRDASGARLWYAVAPAFRNNPARVPLNSDTPGTLAVDALTDVVAVVIAPGAVIGDETRPGAVPDFRTVIASYLEGTNADGDSTFSAAAGNDTIEAVTRRALMAGVERRVLGEVQAIMARYGTVAHAGPGYAGAAQNCTPLSRPCLPWLARWRNPLADKSDIGNAALFIAEVGRRNGLLPVHIPNSWFGDEIGLQWNFIVGGGATVTTIGVKAPEEACAREALCTRAVTTFGDGSRRITNPHSTPLVMTAACRWSAVDAIDCSAVAIDDAAGTYVSPSLQVSAVTRIYAVNVEVTGVASRSVLPASDTRARRRVLTAAGVAAADVRITLTDQLEGEAAQTTELRFTGALGANQFVADVRYDLDPTAGSGEVPPWFIDNLWHQRVFTAFARPYGATGSGDCVDGGADAATRCLTIVAPAATRNDARAVAIVAGRAVAGQARSGNTDNDDWFEGENKATGAVIGSLDGDDRYESAAVSETFSDRLREFDVK